MGLAVIGKQSKTEVYFYYSSVVGKLILVINFSFSLDIKIKNADWSITQKAQSIKSSFRKIFPQQITSTATGDSLKNEIMPNKYLFFFFTENFTMSIITNDF